MNTQDFLDRSRMIDFLIVIVGWFVMIWMHCHYECEKLQTEVKQNHEQHTKIIVLEYSRECETDILTDLPSEVEDVSDEHESEYLPDDCELSLKLELTDDDIDLIAKIIYLEGRGESYECQLAICSVIFNRYFSGKYKSISDVIFEPNQFTTSKYVDSTTASQQQYDVIHDLLDNGPNMPEYVIYFRASRYHTMRDAFDYTTIDGTYFSGSRKIYDSMEVIPE